MTEQLTSKLVELYDRAQGVWDDVTAYVNSDIEIDVGMKTEKYDDRIASVGTFKFTLNDADQVFDLDGNLANGTAMRITLRWHAQTKVFTGIVTNTRPAVGTYGDQSIYVEVSDWMQIALNHKLRTIVVQTNKRIDQALTTMLASIKSQPIATNISTGLETFFMIFDMLKVGRSTFYGELYNLIMSEWSYAYITNDGTLRVENRGTRSGLNNITPISVVIQDLVNGGLLNEDTGYLLNENGGRILRSQTTTTDEWDGLYDDFIGSDIRHGENVINQVEFEIFVKTVDLSFGAYSQLYTYNLYSAQPPIQIPHLATTVLQGEYWDEYPTHRNKIDAAMDMQTPAGPSSDFTYTGNKADLSYTFTGGADSWRWEIFNNGPSAAITYIELFGRPIKNMQTLNTVVDDAPSQLLGDISSLKVSQAYQEEIGLGLEEAAKIIDDEKDPRLVLKSVTMNANKSQTAMLAFMSTDIGSLRWIQMARPAIDKHYWVQGMNINVKRDMSINYTLRLLEQYSFYYGLYPLVLRFSGLTGSKNMVLVPPLRRIANLTAKSISVFVYMRHSPSAVPIVSKFDNLAGHELWILHGGSVEGRVQYNHKFSGTDGVWQTPLNTMNSFVGQWVNITVTYNSTNVANDPIIYVNKVPQTLTETSTPVGTSMDDSQVPLNIGNRYFPGTDKIYDYNGFMAFLQYHNIILSQSQVNTIANNMGDPYAVTAGLHWQGFGAKQELLDEYLDVPIPTTRKLIDNILKYRMSVTYASGTPIEGRELNATMT